MCKSSGLGDEWDPFGEPCVADEGIKGPDQLKKLLLNLVSNPCHQSLIDSLGEGL